MRKSIVLSLLLVMATSVMAQIKIPGTNVQFEFPDGGWKYLQTTTVDENTTVYLYAYAAQNVVDEMGDTILPHLRIYVRKNYTKTVYDLSYERFEMQPYQTLSDFAMPAIGGSLGLIGAYTNMIDNKSYEFRMALLKDRNTAIEFRTETTLDTFDDFDKAFQDIIETLRITK